MQEQSHAKLTLRERRTLAAQVQRQPAEETAKAFGVTPAAIYKRRQRAKKKLSAEQLERYKRLIGPGRRWSPMQLSLAKNI